MNIFVKIQELKRQGFKKLQIASNLKVDVKTVRKYYGMSEKEYSQYVMQCSLRHREMNKYNTFIIKKLQEHPDVSSSQLYDWLRETYKEDFKPSYASVRLHISRLREMEGILKPSSIRQYQEVKELPFGYQAQVDMGQEWLENIYGKRVKVYVFCMSMSNSRHKFAYFNSIPFTTETFIQAHDHAFRFFGGRTQEIVYDQDRVMTVSENFGDLTLTEKFLAYKNYCGFRIYLCRGYDPESKGKIEAVVKYVKHNFLRYRKFTTIENLNSEVLAWLDRTGNGLIHNTTHLVPKVVFTEERKYLTAVPLLEQQEEKPAVYLVHKDNIISYHSNRYAVPKGTYAPDKYVKLKDSGEYLSIFSFDGELLAKHKKPLGRGKLVSINHEERETSKRLEILHNEIFAMLGATANAEIYLKEIAKAYPRYCRDQLGLIKKSCKGYEATEIEKALEYCMTKEIYSGTDFRDTLLFFKSEEAKPTGMQGTLPLQYTSVKIPARELNCYAGIYGGNK